MAQAMSGFMSFGTSPVQTVCAGICAVLAIAQIAIEAESWKELQSHALSGHILPQNYPGEELRILSLVPAHIDYAVNQLLIAASAVTLATSLLCIGYSLQKASHAGLKVDEHRPVTR